MYHYRIADGNDNMIAICWEELNAIQIVHALNRCAMMNNAIDTANHNVARKDEK